MKETIKKVLSSRTVILAILQGIAGVITVILAQAPELQTVGAVAIAKSTVDVLLRLVTSEKLV